MEKKRKLSLERKHNLTGWGVFASGSYIDFCIFVFIP